MVSPTVGTSGSAYQRFSVVTASARSLPVLTCGTIGSRLPTMMGACPASKSVMAAPVLL